MLCIVSRAIRRKPTSEQDPIVAAGRTRLWAAVRDLRVMDPVGQILCGQRYRGTRSVAALRFQCLVHRVEKDFLGG